jgi:hypothetical protein
MAAEVGVQEIVAWFVAPTISGEKVSFFGYTVVNAVVYPTA